MSEKGSMKAKSSGRIMKVCTKPTGEVRVELTGDNRRTADAIWATLPFESNAERWGDEIYFKIPVKFTEENTQTVVKVGDVAYWPPGTSMCIFFRHNACKQSWRTKSIQSSQCFRKGYWRPDDFQKNRKRRENRSWTGRIESVWLQYIEHSTKEVCDCIPWSCFPVL